MGTYLFPLIKPLLAWNPSSIMSYSTAVFSSVPGPVTPFVLDGHKVKSLYYFVPGAGRIGISISAITQAGQLRLGLLSDSSYFMGRETAPKEFVASFERHFVECQ